eukprot:6197630-Pleurochrysis_carterae.AAC.1
MSYHNNRFKEYRNAGRAPRRHSRACAWGSGVGALCHGFELSRFGYVLKLIARGRRAAAAARASSCLTPRLLPLLPLQPRHRDALGLRPAELRRVLVRARRLQRQGLQDCRRAGETLDAIAATTL